MLDELEARHKALLNRRRNVLQKLARRAEDAHNQVLRRIETLDEQYAFIRTHIFWIRDAEPLGAATLAHARDDSIRTARALVRLAMEAVRPLALGPRLARIRPRPGRPGRPPLAALPRPEALDRLRLATTPDRARPGRLRPGSRIGRRLATSAEIGDPIADPRRETPAGIGPIAVAIHDRSPPHAGIATFLIGLASAATWPAYLALAAFAAKVGPLAARPGLAGLRALAGPGGGLVRRDRGPDGVPQRGLGGGGPARPEGGDPAVAAGRPDAGGRRASCSWCPEILLGEGLIAPGGRPISAVGAGADAGPRVRADLLDPGLPAAPVDLAAAGLAGGGPAPARLGGPASPGRGPRSWRPGPGPGPRRAGFRFTVRRLTSAGCSRSSWPAPAGGRTCSCSG